MTRHNHHGSRAARLLVAGLVAACGAAPPSPTAAAAPPMLRPAEPARAVEAAASVGPVKKADGTGLLIRAREQEARGELGLAYTLQVEALDARRTAYGASDPSLLPVLADLARLAHARDDAVAAQQWLRESRDLVSDLGGQAYLAELRELLALGRLHRAAGDPARAAQLCIEVLPGLARELGDDAPFVVDVRVELAQLLLQLDRAEEAEPHLLVALAVAEAHGGELHVDTLHPRRALAVLASDAEDWRVALEQWRLVAKTERRLFGKGFVGQADSRYEIARCLAGLGKLADAETAYELALAGYRSDGGGGAPDHRAIIAMREVGRLRREQQRLVGANEALEAALVEARAALGDTHAETLRCMDELVLVLVDARQLEKARKLAVEALLATPDGDSERKLRKDRATALSSRQERAADGGRRRPESRRDAGRAKDTPPSEPPGGDGAGSR